MAEEQQKQPTYLFDFDSLMHEESPDADRPSPAGCPDADRPLTPSSRRCVEQSLELLKKVQEQLKLPTFDQQMSLDYITQGVEYLGQALRAQNAEAAPWYQLDEIGGGKQRPDFAESLPGCNPDDVQRLYESFESFFPAASSWQVLAPEADATEVAEKIISETAPMMDLGDEAILEAARRDLEAEKPLQALLDLRGKLHQDEDDKSDLGEVIRTLMSDVDAIIDKFGGDAPVAFAKEDEIMRSHIKTYIYDVVEELKAKQATADVLCKDLNSREDGLTEEIRRHSLELNKLVCRHRGKLEQTRIDLLQELVAFYIGRVSSVSQQGEPIELLARKQEEMKDCWCKEQDNYKTMQWCHDEFAELFEGQRKDLEGFARKADEEYQQESKRYKLIKMALKSLQRHHVRRVQDSLQTLLATSQGLTQAAAALEERRLAGEEAKRVAEQAMPKLEEAAGTNQSAGIRLKGAAALLTSFADCMDGAYAGLKAKAERDVQKLADNVPLYGVRCMAVKKALVEDVNAMRAKLDELMQASLADRKRLLAELERLSYRMNDERFPEKQKELDECEIDLNHFNMQREKLSQVLEKSDCEGMHVAEEAAQRADEAVQAQTSVWLNGFHFGGPQPAALCDVAEDDTSSVLSSSNFCIIDETGGPSVDGEQPQGASGKSASATSTDGIVATSEPSGSSGPSEKD